MIKQVASGLLIQDLWKLLLGILLSTYPFNHNSILDGHLSIVFYGNKKVNLILEVKDKLCAMTLEVNTLEHG